MTDPQTSNSRISEATTAPSNAGCERHSDRHFQSKTIAVVDDDNSARDSLGVLLEAVGFNVRTYGSAEELLADTQGPKVSCLIVDQHMPGSDGLTMVAALRRNGGNVPAILITGRLDAGIAARADALGVRGVLEKPYPVARLLELIRGSLEPTRSRQQPTQS